MTVPAERTLRHPVALAVGASAALAAAWAVAVRRPVPDLELRLVTWLSGAPDLVARTMWPVMQLGALGGAVVVSLVVLAATRDRALSVAVVVAALVAWFRAKVLKRVVGRERPLAYLPDLQVRDGSGTGLGFPSGHSAVAAASAVVAAVAVPPRWRPLLVVPVAVVGVARMVHGVHLPADVVGGWAFGTLVGTATVAVLAGRRAGATPVADSDPAEASPER